MYFIFTHIAIFLLLLRSSTNMKTLYLSPQMLSKCENELQTCYLAVFSTIE